MQTMVNAKQKHKILVSLTSTESQQEELQQRKLQLPRKQLFNKDFATMSMLNVSDVVVVIIDESFVLPVQ